MKNVLAKIILLFIPVYGLAFYQIQIADKTEKKEIEKIVTIQSEKRGNPFINFENGYKLTSNDSTGYINNPLGLAKADFDEDGTEDLIVVSGTDNQGLITFRRDLYVHDCSQTSYICAASRKS